METGNVSKSQQPDKEKTARGHQLVFNTARQSNTWRWVSAGP